MAENARQVLKVKEALNLEVKSAIEDLRDKHLQPLRERVESNVESSRSQGNSVKYEEQEITSATCCCNPHDGPNS